MKDGIKRISKVKFHTYHILIVLLIALTLGSVGVGFFIQKNPLITMFDDSLYQVIHKGPNIPIIDTLITPFNYNFLPEALSPGRMPSYYYVMVLFTLIYLSIFKRTLVGWAIFCFFFGTILALWITALDWQLVFRDRPFIKLPNDVDAVGRSAWEKLSSFPSGHARETALYSTIIASFIPKLRWPLFIFVIFIAYSRVYIGAHYPSDVIAGVAIGYLTAKTTLIISRELQILLEKRKELWHGGS